MSVMVRRQEEAMVAELLLALLALEKGVQAGAVVPGPGYATEVTDSTSAS